MATTSSCGTCFLSCNVAISSVEETSIVSAEVLAPISTDSTWICDDGAGVAYDFVLKSATVTKIISEPRFEFAFIAGKVGCEVVFVTLVGG
jgi:hypothetical protein